ncbi:MAG: SprB repeat-containing protein, partial [Ferruginibacter sp.]
LNANQFGCDSLATLNLTVTNFTVVIVQQTLSCLDDNNGTFTATASNGLAPFEYSINNGLNYFPTGIFTNLSGGNYNLRIKDAADCIKDTTVAIGIEKATWTGAVSSDWHTQGNWSNNQVPTANTHVIISNTSVNECIISNNNAVAASIQAKLGTVLKIGNSRTIHIAGSCITLPTN